MVRGGTWKSVDRSTWSGRARNAGDYLRAAEDQLDLAEEGTNGNPIMSLTIQSAIAYGDALSIKFGGIQNTRDHAAIVKAVRQAMGNRADPGQLNRLGQIVGRKSDVQYDFRVSTIDEARSLIEQLRRFSDWAETELARP